MYLRDKIFTKIGSKIVDKIDKILASKNYNLSQVIFVSDTIIWKHNQHLFPKNFLSKFARFLILENPVANENFVDIVAKNSQDCKLIFAFGSGTINDLCKYVASQNNKKYAILISALSMNGYSSKNASIAINNHKKTLEATLPIAILGDLIILKNAPDNLNKAGLADVLCFYSCLFDLQLSRYLFLQKINLQALNLQKKIIQNFVEKYQKLQFNDDNFLKILCKMILNSGIAMTIANSSAPASQSEHLLAHVLTMKYPNTTHNILHGRLIASTTIWALQKQREILLKINGDNYQKSLQNIFDKSSNPKIYSTEISQYFNDDITHECLIEYGYKLEYLQKNHHKIIKNYQKNSLKIQQKLNNFSINPQFLIDIFTHFKVDFSFENIGFTIKQIDESWQYCKYIRNRFTSADLNI